MSRLVVLVVMVAASPWWFGMALAASVCPDDNSAAPEVVTLMATEYNPSKDAWLVWPNCTVKVATSVDSNGLFVLNNKTIQRVESVPSKAVAIKSNNVAFAKGANFSAATSAVSLLIQNTAATTLDLVFPPFLTALTLSGPNLTTIDNLALPPKLMYLLLWGKQLPSLTKTKLPSTLKKLDVWSENITAVDFPLPPTLEELILNDNTISKFENLTLPNTLKTFSCDACGTTTVRGIRWPSTLDSLLLRGNPITNFEIRESDLPTIRFKLTADRIVQSSCADPTATRLSVGIHFVCVITDVRFDSRYGGSSVADPNGSADTDARINNLNGGSNSTDSSTSADAIHTNATLATSSGVVLPIVAGVGSLLVVVMALVGFRFYTHRKQHNTLIKTTGSRITTMTGGGSDKHLSTDESSLQDLTTYFRNDTVIAALRIDQSDLTIGRLIARGGYGAVYNGVFQGRDVAVKQMLPDAWRKNKLLVGFIEEIRLGACLEHPKIVEFIGVAWSSLRDLSAVIEFMSGGDLHSLIHTFPESTGSEWFNSWTPNHLQNKSLIAGDISEAVVYLHSFESAIIHRDLKAKNVLLNKAGNAKLSDFGISREMSIDETMTSEIGTVAWIAPEVLRGERYNEKVDIYSFGVLLVELDRCCHPYAKVDASGIRIDEGETGSMGHTNMQIAMLVSAGRLRPSVSSQCPSSIASLVEWCVRFDPAERPTAMEVFYELRQLRKEHLA